LIVDDGSTDGSREWAASLSDGRVRVLASAGRGIVAALNTGLAAARGVLVARQDADDVSHPQRLEAQVALLRDRLDIDIVATQADFIDRTGAAMHNRWVADVRQVHDPACDPDALRALLPLTCGLVHGSVMARTAVLRDAGGYRAEFEWAEDYDLWLRLLADHRFAKVPRRLYVHRLHAGQASQQKRDLQLQRSLAAKLEFLARNYPGVGPGTRVAVQGAGRGAIMYRRVAESLGMVIVEGPARLFVVTDLAQLNRVQALLPGATWEGNIAIRD
jgi:glycosyltransferase involved in cell wall biosynthesis